MYNGGMKQKSFRLLIGVLTALAFAGCGGNLTSGIRRSPVNGTFTDSAAVTINETPSAVSLTGTVFVQSGILTVSVVDPAGSTVFEEPYVGGTSANLNEPFTPAPGEWVLKVSASTLTGTINLELAYE